MDRKSLSNLSIIKNLTKFKRQYLRKNQYGLLLHSANQSKVRSAAVATLVKARRQMRVTIGRL